MRLEKQGVCGVALSHQSSSCSLSHEVAMGTGALKLETRELSKEGPPWCRPPPPTTDAATARCRTRGAHWLKPNDLPEDQALGDSRF